MTSKIAICLQAIGIIFVTLADAEFHTNLRKLSVSRFPSGAQSNGPVAIFREVNQKDGSYQFGYDTGFNGPQSFREEHRTASGEVYGRYGFVDKQGLLRVTEYVAGRSGYRSEESVRYPVNLSGRKLYKFPDLREAGGKQKPIIGGTPVWLEESQPLVAGLVRIKDQDFKDQDFKDQASVEKRKN